MTATKKDSPKALQPTKKNTRTKYFGFLLTNNKTQLIMGVRNAKVYEDESKDIIKEKQAFSTKTAMDEWAAALVTKSPDPKKDLSSKFEQKMNMDDRAKLDQALKEIDNKRPTDRIEIFPKTTSRSRAVAFVIRFRDVQGRDCWLIKPEAFALAISKWSIIFKQEDKYVGQALSNFSYSRMRDPTGNPDKVSTKSWKSPTTNTERFFDEHLCHSFFLLPEKEDLPTAEDEAKFIDSKCRELGDALLYVIRQESFKMCYERAINHPKIWEAVTGKNSKSGGAGYVDFISQCRTWVSHCDHFNTHIVKDDAVKLSELLQEHNYKDVKYETVQVLDEEDEEGDDEDETENEKSTDKELTLEEKINDAFSK